MNDILRFLFDIKKVYRIYSQRIETDKRLDEIRQEFDSLGFSDGRCNNCDDVLGDPLKDTGTAMRLMRNYKIDLHVGTCYGDCRAVLDKQNWTNGISGPVRGRWTTNEKIEDIDTIYAFGKTVNEAICKCLIFAKTAGVI